MDEVWPNVTAVNVSEKALALMRHEPGDLGCAAFAQSCRVASSSELGGAAGGGGAEEDRDGFRGYAALQAEHNTRIVHNVEASYFPDFPSASGSGVQMTCEAGYLPHLGPESKANSIDLVFPDEACIAPGAPGQLEPFLIFFPSTLATTPPVRSAEQCAEIVLAAEGCGKGWFSFGHHRGGIFDSITAGSPSPSAADPCPACMCKMTVFRDSQRALSGRSITRWFASLWTG